MSEAEHIGRPILSQTSEEIPNTLAAGLAEWCTRLNWADLPATQQELVRLRVLDTLGLIFAGLHAEPTESLLRFALRHRGVHGCTLIGSNERLPANWTAFVHGALAHAWDYDDTFLDSIVHPGSAIIPTALSVGEIVGADGATTGAAVAAGYEVAARLGAAAGRDLHARGFHASGIIGPLAAAATAGRIYELSTAQMTAALGLAASMSGGLLSFLTDGAWSKLLHLGWAAHGGITAAQMAADGFRGPAHVFEGQHGFYDAYTNAEGEALALITRGLGSEWLNTRASAKHYPCAHVIAPYIDGALTLASAHALTTENIRAVTCSLQSWAVPIVCTPRAAKIAPATTIEAIASLPYHVAAALVSGHIDVDTLGAEARADSATLELATRVTHKECAGEADAFAGFIEIETTDDDRHELAVTAEYPSEQKLRDKFRSNTSRYLSSERIEAIEDVLRSEIPAPRILLELATGAQ